MEKIKIIYEDKDVLVINKPAGLTIHAGVKTEKTLVDWLLEKYPEIKNVGEDPARPGIVHRLDKDTSGVMIVAKNQPAYDWLKNQFKNRLVKKTYIALVRGLVEKDFGTINLPISRSLKKRIRQTTKTTAASRAAITEYKVIKRLQDLNLTLVEAYPFTGRMHQIRVHFKSINHPLAGDKIYTTKKYKDFEKFPRLMLHAQKLKIVLPGSIEKIFEAELPEDFKNYID